MTTRVKVRCGNCGAEQTLPAELVTMLIDVTDDEARIIFACTLCGDDRETAPVDADTQTVLLDGGIQLAARMV